MTVITHGFDPDWHESYLIIELLNGGPMPKKILFSKIREDQYKKKVLGQEGITHSDESYEDWLDSHNERQITTENEGQVELTDLGKWIALSEIGTLEDRYLFICNLTCLDCLRAGILAIIEPNRSTAYVNSKGTLIMEAECPNCRQVDKRRGVSDGLSLDQFMSYYEQAISEIRNKAKSMQRLILSDNV